jgi:arylsulfatase A-like enzyme
MAEKKRPNLVILNPDEMRADTLRHLGNPGAVTPNFDRLAAEDGVSFRNAFCQNPVCVPSRCSFLTGWYPHVRGHRTMTHMLHGDEPLLFRTMREQGYHVWMSCRNHFLPRDRENWYEGVADEVCLATDRRLDPPPGFIPLFFTGEVDERRGEPGGDNYYSFYRGRLEPSAASGKFYDRDACWLEGALEFIRKRPRDKPFCLFLSILYPHPAYGVIEPFYSMIDRALVPPRIPTPESWAGKPSILAGLHELLGLKGWDEARWNELRATYLGQVARVDDMFGQLVGALKEEGLYDDTLLMMFSDHGDYAGDYGLVEKTQNTFEDCLVRVPLIVKPPAWEACRPGVRDEALVELIDFYATVEDYCGLTSRHTHFGRSLRPLLSGAAESHREAVFSEGGRLHGEEHCMEIDSNPNLDKKMEYWPRMLLQRSEGPEHTKAIMCRTRDAKYVRRLYETDELYDLNSDPQELHNRIDDPALAPVLADLKEKLLSHYLETCDAVPHTIDSRWPAKEELGRIFALYADGVEPPAEPEEESR